MIFCWDDERKIILNEKLNQVAFFGISGGVLGAILGGSYGLIKGIPIYRIVPRTIFKSAAFLASISAIQGTLEIGRNQQKDAWNPLIAGGWTGFIFGHGLTKRLGYGLALGVNTALLTWALQSFQFPNVMNHLNEAVETLNPILMDKEISPLQEKIESLQKEIESLQESKE